MQVPGSVPLPVCKALDSFNQIAHWLMSANVTHFPTTFTVGGAGPMLQRKPGSYVTKQIRFANTSAKQREREIDWLLMVRCADGHCYSATQDGLYGCDANACEPPHQRGNSRGTSAKGGRTWELKVPHPHAPFSSICFRPLGLKHESEGRASLHQINPNHVVH